MKVFGFYITKDPWQYGFVDGKHARKHRGSGHVQFILWRKGDQKEVDGIGHKKDVWQDFDSSWWGLFVPHEI